MQILLATFMLLGASGAMAPPSSEHRAGVDHRHDQVTGVAHEGSVHHFLLAPDGGSIQLEVEDPGQMEARERIREHLQAIARSFAAGDFAMPAAIHDRMPPGAEGMARWKADIRYEFSPTEKGGRVLISTRNATALAAIHEFLRFQIEDHGTGDPLR